MKKDEERVLAYKLAKEIDFQDLDEVSGGSMRSTVRLTGNSSSADGAGDVSVDW